MNARVIKTPTGAEPITLEQARLHLKLDVYGSPPANDDDTLVEALISAAREDAENYTGLLFTEHTVTAALDNFPNTQALDLTVWPVTAITSVEYEDTSDTTVTIPVEDVAVDNFSRPASLLYKESFWPRSNGKRNSVRITFTAGYEPQGTSPAPDIVLPVVATRAMLLLLGHLYRNRESVNVGNLVTEYPLGYLHLLQPLRIGQGL